jgi:hypothetical protein
MKIIKILGRDIHDHYIVIGVFLSIILISYLDVDHLNKHNCLLLEPTIDCDSYGYIQRQDIIAHQDQYVYIDHTISLYHLDEYRQLEGFMHINCKVGNDTCTFHYDVYKGVVGFATIFDFIGHGAETFDRICWNKYFGDGLSPDIYGCDGIPDSYSVVIIWGLIIFIGYYSSKGLYVLIRWMRNK